MSKVVRIYRHGGPEELRLEDMEIGEPGPGEVRLKVEAIGLNRSETSFRAGQYPILPQMPTLIGYEGVGVIESIGPGVQGPTPGHGLAPGQGPTPGHGLAPGQGPTPGHGLAPGQGPTPGHGLAPGQGPAPGQGLAPGQGFAPGDRVCVLPNYRLGEYGLYAEHAIVPARSLIAPPPNLSPIEAASIWMQYFTALAIVEIARVTVGDYVIIRAASSSVGLAAIQLANWAGAVSIATTRKSDKVEALKANGAAHVIVTEETDLVSEVQRITGGKGARIIFDPVGGPDVDKLALAAAQEGIIFIYGGLSQQPTPYPHWPAALKELSIRGWVASSIWNRPERFARNRALILQGLALGHLKPVIAKTFPLAQIVEAHRYLESNQQVGKIVVTV